MSHIRNLSVFIEEDGQRRPFSLVITRPEKAPDAEDYFCSIQAPVLFKREKSIYGRDAEQAAELAIKLVKDLLSGRQLVGESGNPVILEEAY